MNKLETVPIAQIRVHHRVRRDLGDLKDLRESLRRHGLLNPIVVTPTYDLVAGQRRLEAAKGLGWRAIQCRVVSNAERTGLLEIEIEENTARKDFSSDELADALVRLDRLRNPTIWRRISRWFAGLWRRIMGLFRRNDDSL